MTDAVGGDLSLSQLSISAAMQQEGPKILAMYRQWKFLDIFCE